jgi:hypothetical protein
VTHAAPDAYQARFSPNRLTLLGVVGCAAFCGLVILVPTPLWLRVITLGLFGLAGLLIVAGTLTFHVALRADHAGIMIRRNPFQPSSVTFYPWEDVNRILIWKDNHIKRLAIQRRDSAPLLPAPRLRPITQKYLAVAAPGMPLDVAATAVTANAWHLNERRLAQAVTHFAPTVTVVDVTKGRTLRSGSEPRQGF